MKTICATCDKVIKDGPADEISHGICKRQYVRFMQICKNAGVSAAQKAAQRECATKKQFNEDAVFYGKVF